MCFYRYENTECRRKQPSNKCSNRCKIYYNWCNLYVPVFTLSTEDDNELLQQLKGAFKRKLRNKYRSEMTNQTKSENLSYLIELTQH